MELIDVLIDHLCRTYLNSMYYNKISSGYTTNIPTVVKYNFWLCLEFKKKSYWINLLMVICIGQKVVLILGPRNTCSGSKQEKSLSSQIFPGTLLNGFYEDHSYLFPCFLQYDFYHNREREIFIILTLCYYNSSNNKYI